MSENEIIELYQQLVDYYGDKLANPEHHPIQFAYQIKLYRYYKSKQNG